MDTLAQRTRRLREDRGLSQSRLAREIGVKPQAIQALEAGRVKKPRFILALARALKVSPDYLETGAAAERAVRSLPIEGVAQAGAFRDISLIDPDHEGETINVLADERHAHARQYALRVAGDSMNRRYPEGTYVICANWADTGRALKTGLCLHVERHQGPLVEVTIKVYRESGGRCWLEPDSTNSAHQPIELDGAEDAEIVVKGLVIASYRPE